MSEGNERTSGTAASGGGFGSLGSIVYLLALAWTAAIASYPLNDNSFLTHLATGRLILDEGSVPSTDPYTFTARGEDWTVQSWLASVAYAGFERLAGDFGLRLLILTVFVVAVTLLWKLSAPAHSIITRLLIMALGLFVATDLWSERPYMVGVIGLSVVWLALQDRVRPWLLVPLLWLWTNSHGSFPLAVALCAAVVLGSVLDRRSAGQAMQVPRQEARTSGAVLLGIVLGAIGPLRTEVWLFPLTAMTKSRVFVEIIEWRPPSYQSVAELAFLVLVILVMVLLTRCRPSSWRLVLPAVVFTTAGLFAQRNIVMAAMVLIAVAALTIPDVGTLRGADRPALGRPVAAMLGVLVLLLCGLSLLTPVDGFGGYPARALSFLEAADVEGRLATDMPSGNLIGALDGATGTVFIDDRVDMYPEEVFEDFLILRRGQSGWESVLNRYGIEIVLWSRDQPLSAILAASPEWTSIFVDTQWVVAERRDRK